MYNGYTNKIILSSVQKLMKSTGFTVLFKYYFTNK